MGQSGHRAPPVCRGQAAPLGAVEGHPEGVAVLPPPGKAAGVVRRKPAVRRGAARVGGGAALGLADRGQRDQRARHVSGGKILSCPAPQGGWSGVVAGVVHVRIIWPREKPLQKPREEPAVDDGQMRVRPVGQHRGGWLWMVHEPPRGVVHRLRYRTSTPVRVERSPGDHRGGAQVMPEAVEELSDRKPRDVHCRPQKEDVLVQAEEPRGLME
mmetsp:Transcript_54167/g.89349  ORF Transcript_54167/g.89349 Transcript_54167/m.89349 type:complete len:213 (+) Transcript_54167:992-1630(+)